MISTASTLDVAALPPYEVLRMATVNSAKALKADKYIGTLEEGKKADITLVNVQSCNMCPVNDIFSALVFSLDSANIDSVYVNGKCLLENGKLTTLDEEYIISQVYRRWEKLRKE